MRGIEELSAIRLDKGSHRTFADGHCVMEVVAWFAGRKHTDAPECVSPVLRNFSMKLNDEWGDEDRQKLKTFIPYLVGTAGDGKDELRGWLAADWLVRVYTPTWLELAGIRDS